MTVSVILILVMLLLSAFFSGMEIAFVSKNRLKLEIDRKQSGLLDFVAKVFERHPGQYITSILVGNNIALVVYSLYMSSLLRALAALAGWDVKKQGEKTFPANDARKLRQGMAANRAAKFVVEHSTLTPPPAEPVVEELPR